MEPAGSLGLWLVRSLLVRWSPARLVVLAACTGVAAVFAGIAGTDVPSWLNLLALLAISPIVSGVVMALNRSVSMEVSLQRRIPLLSAAAFVRRRAGACLWIGVVGTLVAGTVSVSPVASIGAAPPWFAGCVAFGMLVSALTASVAIDDSDTIEALQRLVVYILHRPVTALAVLGPAMLAMVGFAACGWAVWVVGFWSAAAAGLGCVAGHLAMSLTVGAYLILRYANDGADPAEITQSGAEGGVLKSVQST